ncbi:MAG: NADP-dependent isocitrate dehydrogenase [Acidimicrobiia bacterium]|nr:NADP-dependent isocitrate dehydrogenase [Acidimicrobiia bacterium]
MTATDATIIWTLTDEAPALATRSLLPVIEVFAGAAGVDVETRDISLAGRILAAFPELAAEGPDVSDDLAELGELVRRPEANVVKLPNISASVPQMEAAIAELRAQGHTLPDYPAEPSTPEEHDAKERYDKVKGSAVNPVLREGNSDRRAPAAVKRFARSHPHSMGAWSADSATHVAHMDGDDFRSNEQSFTMATDDELTIDLVEADGTRTALRDPVVVTAGDVVDTTALRVAVLRRFLDDQLDDARRRGVLFSVHLKATMMKVSDPIIFGHVVRAYFAPVFDRHGEALERAGVDPNNGLGELLARLDALPAAEADAIRADIDTALAEGPPLAMVDSDRGITNLHVPSDVIIDASMPAMIRSSGQMWNAEGNQQDTKCVIPDSSYAGVYEVVIEDCKANGAFDPTTMGSVANVGLMAQKAEEYGSHDKTFEIPRTGVVEVTNRDGTVLSSHSVAPGDIWRMCRTTDAAVADWVKLAVTRARATGTPAVFWLDAERAHDARLIAKVEHELAALDTDGIEIEIMAPVAATRHAVERLRAGLDTISVTGNVLRDYLTDLFPILEVGTSAKMLSIVPLMAGGGLFETGAGGSAPKHVQQLVAENHLRWDSLGEFLALTASFEHLATTTDNPRAAVLAETLDVAIGRLLEEGRSPSRRVGEIDNRGSHFYLALYWAEAVAAQSDDAELAAALAPLAAALAEHEATIAAELLDTQGVAVDLGGYYRPDAGRAVAIMRPSPTLNRLLDEMAP